MEDITWELKNLDSLKEYIFDELIGEHKNTKDINEAINRYAERYHEIQLKLLGLHNVSQQRELLRSYNKFVNEKCLLADGTLSNFEIEKFEERNCG